MARGREMFKSPTYGKMDISQIPDRILMFYQNHQQYEMPVHIIVGTDSQNFDYTKIVSVIAVVCEGHGGIFFYEITHQPLIRDVRTKLHVETNDSLKGAEHKRKDKGADLGVGRLDQGLRL